VVIDLLGQSLPAGVILMMGAEFLGRLFDQHAAALVLYARQWCATPEDVVQEALLKLVAQNKPPDRPIAWLFRVVRNGAISAARSSKRRRYHEGVAATRTPAWFAPAEGAGIDGATATAALQTLPLEEREAIIAHLWGGLTFEQIGELTGTSSSTAHRSYMAGLAALRERLGIECPQKPTTRS
jgi:RNA polymerase sigma factor (sigma-70 family)